MDTFQKIISMGSWFYTFLSPLIPLSAGDYDFSTGSFATELPDVSVGVLVVGATLDDSEGEGAV